MARRERTTGRPRARRKERQTSGNRQSRFWNEKTQRYFILGVPALLLVLLGGLVGWRWYSDNFVRPDTVILQVEDREVTLGYFANRLPQYQQANQSSFDTAPQALFRKLEDEELTLLLAEERGITFADDELNEHIAEGLGVEYSTERGSPFDSAYRNLLSESDISDGTYRRLARAELADARLRELLLSETDTTGETFSYRFFSVADEELAIDAVQRIEGGVDFDEVADELSPIPSPTPAPSPTATPTPAETPTTDGTTTPGASPTEDGEAPGEDGETPGGPVDLRQRNDDIVQQIPDEVVPLLADAEVGDVLGPVQINAQWYIILLTDHATDAELDEEQLGIIVGERLDEAINELRGRATIERDLDSDDISWARDNA